MNRARALVTLGSGIVLACGVLIAGKTSGWLVALAGLLFVLGGALLTSIVSVGYRPVETVLRGVPKLFAPSRPRDTDEELTLLKIAELYRRGGIRRAETQIQTLTDPLLRQGAQMIVDRCAREELDRALLWNIANTRQRVNQHLSVLHGLAGYAPAFGMLGTLLGLVRLLFGLGESGLDVLGTAMGFAMITTVYGLVTANLVIKPLATKMAQRSHQELARQQVKYELLIMMFKREHPAMMRESLALFLSGEPETEPRKFQAPLALVQT